MQVQILVRRYNAERGFIALMATIIIGAMMLLVTVALVQSGYAVRSQVSGMEYKALSMSVAEGCVATILMDRLEARKYSGGVSLSDGSGTCYIAALEYDNPSQRFTIRVQGVVAQSYTNLEYVYDLQDVHQGTIPLDPGTASDPTKLVPILMSRKELPAMP